MIIDIHRHMWSVTQRHPRVAEIAKRATKIGYRPPEEIPLVPDVDATADAIVAEMDGAGVDISALVLADYHMLLSDAIFSPEGENRVQIHMSQRHPERLIPFFGIDPRSPKSAELFELGLKDWGVKGLILHPTVGFFPHDPACYPLYEKCIEYGVPVISHSGPMRSPLYSKYAMPIEFDQVAADFPDLILILAHAGQGLSAMPDMSIDALAIALEKPNIVLELSLWQILYKESPSSFLTALDRMRNEIGVERIVFGADFPGPRDVMPLRDWVDAFKALPALGDEHGVRFDDRDVDGILGGNSSRILGL